MIYIKQHKQILKMEKRNEKRFDVFIIIQYTLVFTIPSIIAVYSSTQTSNLDLKVFLLICALLYSPIWFVSLRLFHATKVGKASFESDTYFYKLMILLTFIIALTVVGVLAFPTYTSPTT